ncbi:MAG: hypothetical protein NZ937_09880, partial [Armatimonadetes bacterium]|nr:hypothetical protein [Armatimonadota bacterium]
QNSQNQLLIAIRRLNDNASNRKRKKTLHKFIYPFLVVPKLQKFIPWTKVNIKFFFADVNFQKDLALF